MDDQLRCVYVANGDIEAQQVQAFLEAAGIATLARTETLQRLYGLSIDGLGRVEVLVSAADERQARDLLASAESGAFRIRD